MTTNVDRYWQQFIESLPPDQPTQQLDGKPLPRVGDLCIALPGPDDPACVIETVEVRVIPYDIPYDEVGEEYARDGGEWDRTLATWRQNYWDYIVSECQRLGRDPARDAPLNMERFRVVYREPLQRALPGKTPA